jgi:ribonuclease E
MGISRQILISEKESRAVVLEDNRVIEFYFLKNGPQVGDVYLGKVENIYEGLDAGFVIIGETKNGYLHIDDIAKNNKSREDKISNILQKDAPLLVQVIKEPTREKGAKLTTEISIPGRYLVLLPFHNKVHLSKNISNPEERDRLLEVVNGLNTDNYGLIVRTEAQEMALKDIKTDYVYLTRLWKRLQQESTAKKPPTLLYRDNDLIYKSMRDWCSSDISLIQVDTILGFLKAKRQAKIWASDVAKKVKYHFGLTSIFAKHKIDEAISNALNPVVPLKSGGFLVIESTEAFSTIDVNTGSFTGGKGQNLAQTILQTNCEAAEEIAHQLKIRNIAGVIVVDLITMDNKRDKDRVRSVLIEALKRDKANPEVGKFTDLGLIEITRKRQGISLREAMTKECPECKGTGRIMLTKEEFNAKFGIKK